jgi:predicted nucleotidyltransferase
VNAPLNALLTEHQSRVAARILDEESRQRAHLVVSLSGAHAYGFPSPDSDLDLKCIHVEPTRALLSLGWVHRPAERLEVVDGVEIDYSSNELQPVLAGILQGNGNYLERVLGPLPLRAAPELEALRPLVRRSLSRRLHRHYRGFATSQLREWEKGGFRSAKKLLYVLRTNLTGTHALLTGEVVTDVTLLLDTYGFGEARELVEQKRRGEKAELPDAMVERWKGQVQRAFEQLDAARERSPLPEEPANVEELDAWLLELRRARF